MRLVVGNEGVEYKVHKTLLSKHPEYFAPATQEECEGGQDHTVVLLNDTPPIVELYLHWLYTGRIFSLGKTVKQDGDGRHDEFNKNAHMFDLLVDGFIFGEKVQDGNFKDAVIDTLIHTVTTPDVAGVCWYPTRRLMTRAYAETHEGSPIRRLLVDMYMFHGRDEWVDGQHYVDLLADFAGYLSVESGADEKDQRYVESIRLRVNTCQYHHHSKEDQCYLKKGASNVMEE
jgi:hypothetical protein